ncbi:hypothetical protein GCM10010207_14090 [Streptomyces atratus]|nr:hypothetical protein GCM10010207_14090 [Streptomyces atratus]
MGQAPQLIGEAGAVAPDGSGAAAAPGTARAVEADRARSTERTRRLVFGFLFGFMFMFTRMLVFMRGTVPAPRDRASMGT